MNDTTHEITQKMCELIRKKTPVERLKLGWSMYETSKYLVTRAILEKNPQISVSDFRQEIFLRFYRNDFDEDTKMKVLKYLASLETKHER